MHVNVRRRRRRARALRPPVLPRRSGYPWYACLVGLTPRGRAGIFEKDGGGARHPSTARASEVGGRCLLRGQHVRVSLRCRWGQAEPSTGCRWDGYQRRRPRPGGGATSATPGRQARHPEAMRAANGTRAYGGAGVDRGSGPGAAHHSPIEHPSRGLSMNEYLSTGSGQASTNTSAFAAEPLA